MTWMRELWRRRWTRGSDERDFELRLSLAATEADGEGLCWHAQFGEIERHGVRALVALSYPLSTEGFDCALRVLRLWSSEGAGPVRGCVPEVGAVELVTQAEGLSDYARSLALHRLTGSPAPRHGSCYETLIGGGTRAGAFAFG